MLIYPNVKLLFISAFVKEHYFNYGQPNSTWVDSFETKLVPREITIASRLLRMNVLPKSSEQPADAEKLD